MFPQWSTYKKILCIRTDNLGDVLMTEPAIRSLKQGLGNREIHLLTSHAGALGAALISGIDKLITTDPPWNQVKDPDPDRFMELAASLEQEQYDGAVIFTVHSQNPMPAAMLCFLAGIQDVAGYCRENPYNLMKSWIPDDEPLFRIRHEVKRQLWLVSNLGGAKTDPKMRITVDAEDVSSFIEKISPITAGDPFIVIHPGVSEKRRQYPWELLAEAAIRIRDTARVRILLGGSAQEKELCNNIVRVCGPQVTSLAGMLTIREYAALIAATPLLISNNTGPVHIAAAAGTKTIVLYAQTNPQHRPWMADHVLIPFDVPPEERSRNRLVEFTYRRYFNNVRLPEPDEIAQHAISILNPLMQPTLTPEECP